MKKSEAFAPLLGNEPLKERLGILLEQDKLSHAIAILGEDGTGRNFAARLLAAAWLEDEKEQVARGIHPDCLVVTGSGAAGEIKVESVRDALFELTKSAVSANGRRVAIIRDAGKLNKSSANALLKMLEEPRKGVMFILTARHEQELLQTINSRCSRFYTQPIPVAQCVAAVHSRWPDYDRTRTENVCGLYGGRLGLVYKALSDPQRLALCDAARRFVDAALAGDALTAASVLDGVGGGKNDVRAVLFDASLGLRQALENGAPAGRVTRIHEACVQGIGDLDRNVHIKLLCTHIACAL